MAYEKNMNYAGFWKRFAAGFIDQFILIILGGIVGFIVGVILGFIAASMRLSDDGVAIANSAFWLGYIVGVLVAWIYYAAFESSSKQATPGKMALGIKVTDLNGRRIGFRKATGRLFGKIVSGVIFFIGFIMIAFTEKKQGLHDKMAGCLVVNK